VPFVPESVQLQEGGADSPDDWLMRAPLSWTGTFRGQIGRILVPASPDVPFVTDLASVPRALTWLIPRYGMYTKAAVVHDYLCQNVGRDTVEVFATPSTAGDSGAAPSQSREIRIADRSDADEVFRLVMTELGVPWARRWLMWGAVSWATLWTTLWPGRSSRPVLRWVGRALLLVAPTVIGLLVWAGTVAWFVGDGGWRWLRIAALVVVGGALGAGVLLGAGYVAQGRWDRWLVYLAALAMTIASLPLLAAGAAIALLLVFYLLFEDMFSGFRAARGRLRRLLSRQPAAPSARAARVEAVRAS
jgi:uncharacterized protein DUF1353